MSLFWLFWALVALGAAWRVTFLGRFARFALLLVAIGLGLVGVGVVQLPAVDQLIEQIGRRLGAWSYVLVGVNAFLETGAFLGFLVPGETMVLFGGVLAGEGTIDLVPLILIVWAAAMLGDLTSYAIGHRYGRGFLLRHGERVKIREPQVEFVERYFARYGLMTVFFGRWIGMVRPLVPFLAGSTRVRFWKFMAVDFFSTLVWAVLLCVLGAIFWHNFDQLAGLVSQFFFTLGTILVVLLVTVVAVTTRRSPARNDAVEAWIAEQRGDHPVIGRCAGSVWSVVARLEPTFPGRRRASRLADEAGTVAEAPSRADDLHDDR